MTALAFIAGAATAIVRGWGSPLVTVDVVNRSGADLRAVLLEVDTCGSKQQVLGSAWRWVRLGPYAAVLATLPRLSCSARIHHCSIDPSSMKRMCDAISNSSRSSGDNWRST